MPQYTPPRNYGCLGAFLLTIGICLACGGGIQGFGDRMPNPPPDIQAQFEAINKTIGWMVGVGAVFVFAGAICFAASMSTGKIEFRNQKRD